MEISEDLSKSNFIIESYTKNNITVSGKKYNSSLVITPSQIIQNWDVKSVEDLTLDLFLPILDLKPEIILLGTGDNLIFPDSKIISDILQHDIGFEVMTTSAACRTFRVLESEYRNVAAALII